MNIKNTTRIRDEVVASTCDSIRRAAATLDRYDKDGFQKSCINCRFFKEPVELCEKYAARPPARIIALSCPTYEDTNEIPF